jgi:hypothetical protein
MSSTQALLSIDSALIAGLVFVALAVSRLSQRVARLEERTSRRKRKDDEE